MSTIREESFRKELGALKSATDPSGNSSALGSGLCSELQVSHLQNGGGTRPVLGQGTSAKPLAQGWHLGTVTVTWFKCHTTP